MIEKKSIEMAIRSALPEARHSDISELVELIIGHITGGTTTQIVNDESKQSLLFKSLAGKRITSENAIISFGNGSQYGDVTIGDIAGRDMYQVNIFMKNTSKGAFDNFFDNLEIGGKLSFGEQLAIFRERRGATHSELAKGMGINPSIVDHWESGKIYPKRRAVLLKISELLSLNQLETDILLCSADFSPLYLENCDAVAIAAGQITKEELTIREKYCNVVARELDKFEMFGIPQMDALTRRQSLSMAYITLSAVERTTKSLPEEISKSSAVLSRVINDSLSSTLRTYGSIIDLNSSSVTIDQMLSKNRRIIIRGDAGAGKTTLLQWLAVRSARRDFPSILSQWNSTVPFFIRLRSLVDGNFPRPEDFVELVDRNGSSGTSKQWVKQQLEKGNALILIDGVDELPRQQRSTMLDELDRLIDDYPRARFIITSRPSGLKDTKGQPWAEWEEWTRKKSFLELVLEPMSPSDIRDFVFQWHSALSNSQSTEEADKFHLLAKGLLRLLRHRPQLRRLATNPLLCSMICALHRERQENLPVERIQLYRLCIEMLLERDQGRKIKIELDEAYPKGLGYEQKLALIQKFAYWLMLNGYSDVELSRADDHFSSHLEFMNLPKTVTGAQVRSLFVDRANLLREPVVGRIDFLHRTFQEFLAAQAALNEDSIGTLLNNAHNDQWRETIIVAAGLARTRERQELLEGLIRKGKTDLKNRYYLHLLAVACLETTIELPPAVRATVTEHAKDLLPPRDADSRKAIINAGDAIVDLLHAKPEYSEVEAKNCIEVLAAIGSPSALSILTTFADDNRSVVLHELRKAWDHFDRGAFAFTVFSETTKVYASAIDSWDGFEHLKHLTHLDMSIDESSTSISSLEPLTSLVNLNSLFLQCGHISDIRPLARLEDLKTLHISGVMLQDLEVISQLKNLEVLTISNFQNFSGESNILERFNLVQTRNHLSIREIGFVTHLTKLKSLTIGETSVQDFQPISKLTSLEYLVIESTLVTDLSFLLPLQNLREIDIRELDLDDISPLSKLTRLSKATIRNRVIKTDRQWRPSQ